jgi:hypothetical protein
MSHPTIPALRNEAIRALVIVPPFLKYTNGPLLGPAMLAGAGRHAGHTVEVANLATAWIADHYSEEHYSTPFIGDHDKSSGAFDAFERDWCRRCAATCWNDLRDRSIEDLVRNLKVSHDQAQWAARLLCDSEVGRWLNRKVTAFAKPRVVGISVMYSGQVLAALALARIVRMRWPCAFIVFGGAHVTALGEEIAHDPRYGVGVDGFAIGYAEQTWVDLLDAVANGTAWPAEVIKAGSGLRRANDAPDTVPYFGVITAWGGRLTLPAQSSRGCVYGKCTFCTYPAIEGSARKLDLSPVRAVLAEAERLRAAVSFKDSLVTPNRLLDLAGVVAGRVPWSACTKLHPRLNADVLKNWRTPVAARSKSDWRHLRRADRNSSLSDSRPNCF